MKNILWWTGPHWLKKSEQKWQCTDCNADVLNDQSFESELIGKKEMKEINLIQPPEDCVEEIEFTRECSPFEIKSKKYSSFTKLIRVTTYILRFIRQLRSSKMKEKQGNSNIYPEFLSTAELKEAEKLWICHIQRKHFQDCYEAIENKKRCNLQKQLGVYLGASGLMRCKGRLDNSDLNESAKHPILLPKDDRVTHLIIVNTHRHILHSGVSQTYGRATVRSVINKCQICRRQEGGPHKVPPMPPLPKTRVTEAYPFSRTGLDYLGPLYIKSNGEHKKTWVCLFTCLVTRGIQLEHMKDMTTEEFLCGFRRFISVRGTPVEIISDNALQFKTADKVFDIVWRDIVRCAEVQNYISNSRIKWSFIVELASWMVGFYERLVGLVKRALLKSLGRNLVTETQLQTLLKEVEAVVNNRRLVYVGDDINSSITLTPRHFLSLNSYMGVPELENCETDEDFNPDESTADRLLQNWKKGQKFLNGFWKLSRDDYLLSLREREQASIECGRIFSSSMPKIGDVVLIKDNLPRGCWNMGKIVDPIISADGNIRSVKVKLRSGRVIGRPLNMLFPIEVSNEDSEGTEFLPQSNPTCDKRRPIRQAPIRANAKLKEKCCH